VEAAVTTVIKIGGALLDRAEQLAEIWSAITDLSSTSRIVLVHGGGPQSTALARRFGHEPRIVHGRRVTSDLDLSILLWTARGEINSRLVASGLQAGARPVGLSGVDGALIRAEKRPAWMIDGESVDFGHVGDIFKIDTSLLDVLIDNGFMPVVAPVGADSDGNLFNINADTIACEIAVALEADQLLMVAESGGLRKDRDDAGSLIQAMNRADLDDGVLNGWIQDGMRVKVAMALDALDRGVATVRIAPPSGIADLSFGTTITL
jgi:acetylglutamate kinase